MIKNNFDIYTKQADIYGKADYWRSDEEFLVNKYFNPQKGRKLLVLGCGGGRTLPYLQEKGFDITAIDIVPKMVEAAQKKVQGLNIKVLEMDATNLKFDNESFDYVFFPFHGLGCIYPNIYRAVSEAERVLKKDGLAIFNLHNRFFLRGIYKKFKKYFKKVIISYRISMLPWKHANWKDVCYKLIPILDKSMYFICKK